MALMFFRKSLRGNDLGGLPFTDVLSEAMVKQALSTVGECWLDRIYSPLITTWLFLSQVLNEDQSCRKVVARLIAHRLSLRQRACSALTGAYCQARKRLSEKFFLEVARQTGQALDARQFRLALERFTRSHLRWLDGIDS